jgi:hypothetical protein
MMNCVWECGLSRLRAVFSRHKGVLSSDSGVVTVEWVALAAGLVVGSIVVSFIIMQGLVGAANSIADDLNDFAN